MRDETFCYRATPGVTNIPTWPNTENIKWVCSKYGVQRLHLNSIQEHGDPITRVANAAWRPDLDKDYESHTYTMCAHALSKGREDRVRVLPTADTRDVYVKVIRVSDEPRWVLQPVAFEMKDSGVGHSVLLARCDKKTYYFDPNGSEWGRQHSESEMKKVQAMHEWSDGEWMLDDMDQSSFIQYISTEGICAAVTGWIMSTIVMTEYVVPESLRKYLDHRRAQWREAKLTVEDAQNNYKQLYEMARKEPDIEVSFFEHRMLGILREKVSPTDCEIFTELKKKSEFIKKNRNNTNTDKEWFNYVVERYNELLQVVDTPLEEQVSTVKDCGTDTPKHVQSNVISSKIQPRADISFDKARLREAMVRYGVMISYMEVQMRIFMRYVHELTESLKERHPPLIKCAVYASSNGDRIADHEFRHGADGVFKAKNKSPLKTLRIDVKGATWSTRHDGTELRSIRVNPVHYSYSTLDIVHKGKNYYCELEPVWHE